MSPTDLVGPSPVTSNGTETTEIEDDASDEVHAQITQERDGSHRTEVGHRFAEGLENTMPNSRIACRTHDLTARSRSPARG
jgi:hypothetical protein